MTWWHQNRYVYKDWSLVERWRRTLTWALYVGPLFGAIVDLLSKNYRELYPLRRSRLTLSLSHWLLQSSHMRVMFKFSVEYGRELKDNLGATAERHASHQLNDRTKKLSRKYWGYWRHCNNIPRLWIGVMLNHGLQDPDRTYGWYLDAERSPTTFSTCIQGVR